MDHVFIAPLRCARAYGSAVRLLFLAFPAFTLRRVLRASGHAGLFSVGPLGRDWRRGSDNEIQSPRVSSAACMQINKAVFW